MIKFTIVIPTYNRADYIVIALKSVLSQTYTNFEVIIVDDGSTDNTMDAIRPFLRENIKYTRIENSERGAARNYGCALATGDYITFLDSDDYYYPHYLSNAYETISNYNKPPFLHLAYEIVSSDGKSKTRYNSLKSDDTKFIVKGNPLSCMGVFIRKDICAKFKFNEDRLLAGSEDWELWLRIIANCGIKTDNRISAALVDHSTRSVLNYKEELLVKRKELTLHYAFKDDELKRKYTKYYKKINSYCDSYISLHLALSGNKKRAIYYFINSIVCWPFSIFERRSLAIVKKLLL